MWLVELERNIGPPQMVAMWVYNWYTLAQSKTVSYAAYVSSRKRGSNAIL